MEELTPIEPVPPKGLYSGEGRSGICFCGHKWDEHHLGVVARLSYVNQTGEYYIPWECEYFGCNELGGTDGHGNPHCFNYVDKGLE